MGHGGRRGAGLLKMDFLGLRNLTILSKAVDLIRRNDAASEIDPYQFPLDDQETFALLCRGETKGIFQLESGGIRDLLQRMKPDHFRDIIATNALYRPVRSKAAWSTTTSRSSMAARRPSISIR